MVMCLVFVHIATLQQFLKYSMKKTKKIFIVKVIVNGKTVPDFGMGKGVLGEQEIAFTDEMGRGFNSPLFIRSKMEYEDRLLRELCHVEWKEIRPKKKKSKK